MGKLAARFQDFGQRWGRDDGHHGPGEKAGQHHAQLGGRQKAAGIFSQAFGGPSRSHTFIDQLFQACLAHIDEGGAAHRQKTVEGHEP